MAQGNSTLRESDLVIGVEDGEGKGYFVTLAVPRYGSQFAPVFAVGARYEAIRNLQSVAKKTRKAGGDVAAALAAAAENPTFDVAADRIETVGTLRAKMAGAIIEEIARKQGKWPTDEASQKATVAKHTPTILEKRAEEVTARVHAYLAAGYTPKARGTGGAKGEAVSAELDL